MATEQQVRVAGRLYEIRDAMRGLFGPKFAERVQPYRCLLERVQTQQECDVLGAAMWLGRRVDPTDTAEILLIMAAAVEMIEPSPTTVTGEP